MANSEVIARLVRQLLDGDGSAFNPLWDELLGSGDRRITFLGEWLDVLSKSNKPDDRLPSIRYSPDGARDFLRHMFHRELSGETAQQIIGTFFESHKPVVSSNAGPVTTSGTVMTMTTSVGTTVSSIYPQPTEKAEADWLAEQPIGNVIQRINSKNSLSGDVVLYSQTYLMFPMNKFVQVGDAVYDGHEFQDRKFIGHVYAMMGQNIGDLVSIRMGQS